MWAGRDQAPGQPGYRAEQRRSASGAQVGDQIGVAAAYADVDCRGAHAQVEQHAGAVPVAQRLSGPARAR